MTPGYAAMARTLADIRSGRYWLMVQCRCKTIYLPAGKIPKHWPDSMTIAAVATRFRCVGRCGERPFHVAAVTYAEMTGPTGGMN